MKLAPIFEQKAPKDHAMQSAAIQLMRMCRPFLELINYNIPYFPLFRGAAKIHDNKDILIKRQVRLTGRNPRDSVGVHHDTLNEFFMAKFGEPFRDALFVTGNQMVADGYGPQVYFVFPIGKFSFVWSRNIPDALNLQNSFAKHATKYVQQDHPDMTSQEAYEYARNIQNNIRYGFHPAEYIPEYKDLILRILNDANYTNVDLGGAIESDHEIAIRCNEVFIMPHGYEFDLQEAVDDIRQQLRI